MQEVGVPWEARDQLAKPLRAISGGNGHTNKGCMIRESYSTENKLYKASAKEWALGLVNFVPAVAHHFYLNWPAAFTQPGLSLLADHSSWFLLLLTTSASTCMLHSRNLEH